MYGVWCGVPQMKKIPFKYYMNIDIIKKSNSRSPIKCCAFSTSIYLSSTTKSFCDQHLVKSNASHSAKPPWKKYKDLSE